MYFFRSMLEQIGQAMLAALDDPEAVLKSLERQLARSEHGRNNLQVPNLVSLVGAPKAEEFLRRASIAAGKRGIVGEWAQRDFEARRKGSRWN
jgi:hypothetical protein